MLSRWLTTIFVILLFCSCCLQLSCGRQLQTKQSIPPATSDPILRLPSPGAPLATPPPTPYDTPGKPPLSETAAAQFWDVKVLNAIFLQDNMPTDRETPAGLNAVLQVNNRQKQALSLHWEALLYDANKNHSYPVNVFFLRRRQQLTSLTVKPGARAEVQLRSVVPHIRFTIGGENPYLMFLLKFTDDKGNSVAVQPRLKFQMTY